MSSSSEKKNVGNLRNNVATWLEHGNVKRKRRIY